MPIDPIQHQAAADTFKWASLVGPAVVAAAISALVAWVSTSRRFAVDRELAERKITADMELAERRFEFDRTLAEKKVELEVAIAEKKVALDRVLFAWKRKAEFAEEVLADFYEARDVLNSVRSPLVLAGEGSSRDRSSSESEDEERRLNVHYAPIERLKIKDEFFARLHARRYRFAASFGRDATTPYDALLNYHHRIAIAARMLLDTYEDRDEGGLKSQRIKWRNVVSWSGSEDPMPGELDKIVSQIEAVCSAAIVAGEP